MMGYLKVKDSFQPAGLVHLSLSLKLRSLHWLVLVVDLKMDRWPVFVTNFQQLLGSQFESHLTSILFYFPPSYLSQLCCGCVYNVVETDLEFGVAKTYVETSKD